SPSASSTSRATPPSRDRPTTSSSTATPTSTKASAASSSSANPNRSRLSARAPPIIPSEAHPMTLQQQIADFLAGSPHGVVGASRDRAKFGNKVLRTSQ